MIKAKNNIIVKIDWDSKKEYAILNPISGSFDIMSEKEHKAYQDLDLNIDEKIKLAKLYKSLNDLNQDTVELVTYLLERGYLYTDKDEEDKAISNAREDFDEEMSKSEIQLMLIPTYSCNLACTYCFQHGIDDKPKLISKETVDAFFSYANLTFKNEKVKPFITLFGGEPLMNSKEQREIIDYIVDMANKFEYELSFVTNGYDFAEFIEILKKAKIREVQFTLDGTKEVHDVRRITAGGKGSFDRVLNSIELAVENGISVNLRSVTDTDNIENLVEMAKILDEKGFLDLPPEKFKTAIGRNYELFECYEKKSQLLSQVELWAEIARLGKEYPVMKKFHRPDFYGIRYLVDTGELYIPSFDTCPAGKTEWVFDLNGEIYGCTASCGREEFKLGTFWPGISLNENSVETWKNRDVAKIEKCKDCSYDAVCGGGCGVVASNKNGGEILSPDCRPIQEMYEIGINYYWDEIKKLATE